MMPEDALDVLRAHDAVPDGRRRRPVGARPRLALGARSSPIRQRLDLWANVRPGAAARRDPLPARGPRRRPTSTCSSCARTPRASTRASAGARTTGLAVRGRRSRRASSRAPASSGWSATRSSSPQTRRGVVTSATKSNASRFGYVLWDEVAEEVAAELPGRALRARARRRARRADGARPRQPRRRRRLEPVRRHPHRPRRGDPGRHGHGREREPRARHRARPACSSRCTARRRTSPGRGSPIRPARSGARR